MRKLLLLAPGLLLASCHGAHVAQRSQPVVSEAVAASAPTPPLDSTLAATVVVTRPAAAAGAVTPRPLAPPRLRHASALRPLAKLATAGITTPVARQLARRVQRPRTTEGVAESGLGRVGLFFIGVVLAVLAGLAALVNLIFSVGFFTALGYTAAGLVVLFLLYSLLSKGNKKT